MGRERVRGLRVGDGMMGAGDPMRVGGLVAIEGVDLVMA